MPSLIEIFFNDLKAVTKIPSYSPLLWSTVRPEVENSSYIENDLSCCQIDFENGVRISLLLWNSSPFEHRVSRELEFSSLLSLLSPRKDL